MQPGNNSCTNVQVRLTKTIISGTLLSILTERGVFMKRICPSVQFDHSSSIYLIFDSASIVATSTRKCQRYRFYLVLFRTTRGKDARYYDAKTIIEIRFLSERYANHSIRVTSLQVLEDPIAKSVRSGD